MPILTHEERIGTLLAEKYRLESILGRGGMGAVFSARHEWTGRRVAIKLLNYEYTAHQEMGERFLREARAVGALDHPNVIDVLDMGKDVDGTVYLVLERLEGQTLASLLLEKGRLEPVRAFELLMPVMRALAYAHRKGVVHRDLKPDNIYISDDPENGLVPKLLDFGIAKVVDGDRPTANTRTGTIIGTAEYMSPEQARGAADIGPATDVWSMGVVWYETLTGVVPFEGTNATAVILAIVDGKHDRLEAKLPNLAKPVAAGVERALLVERAERYADMNGFIEALEAARRGLSMAPPPLETSAALPVLPRSSETAATQPFIELAATTEPSSRIELAVSVPPPAVRAAPSEMTAKLVALDADGEPVTEGRSSTTLEWSDSPSTPRRGRTVAFAALGLAVLSGGAFFARSGSHHGAATGTTEPVTHVAARATPVAPLAPAVVAPAPVAVIAPPAPVVAPPAPVAMAVVAPVADEPVVASHAGRHDARHATRSAHGAPPPAAGTAVAPPTPVAVATPAPATPTPPPTPAVVAPATPPATPPAAHPHGTAPRNPNTPLTDYELGS